MGRTIILLTLFSQSYIFYNGDYSMLDKMLLDFFLLFMFLKNNLSHSNSKLRAVWMTLILNIYLNIYLKFWVKFLLCFKRHPTMNKVWNMGLSSSFSFSKVFFLLMVLIVSSSSPSPSPSNDSPSNYEGLFHRF